MFNFFKKNHSQIQQDISNVHPFSEMEVAKLAAWGAKGVTTVENKLEFAA